METSDNINNQPYISDTSSDIDILDSEHNETQDSVADNAVEEIDSINTDGEDNAENIEESVPIFEREEWHDMVDNFEERYPLARELEGEIGDVLLEDESLWMNEQCLETALLRVLCDRYMPDSDKASDETFLENYIYSNEDIRSKIVDEYMEELDKSRMPSMMTRGGRISLAEPARPRTLREAGAIAERIMKR